MLKRTLILAFATGVVRFVAADDPAGPAPVGRPRAITWAKTFPEATEAARKSGKPLLVDFGAEWCGFCKKLDRETFTDPAVVQLIEESFVAVKVDADKEPELAKKFEVAGLPTLIFLSPGGEKLEKLEGFRPPDVFLKEARKPAASSAALAELKELAEKSPTDLSAQRAHARALASSGNLEGAARVLERAIAAAPGAASDPGFLFDQADLYRAQRKLAEARTAYGKILALDPALAGESRRRAFLPLALVLVELKDAPAAIAALDELLRLEDLKGLDRVQAHYLRGYLHAQRKDAERALADLKLARDADPNGRWGLRASAILETLEAK